MRRTQLLGDQIETDVVVFGSGAAGMTAALVASLQGFDVLLCEKAPVLGGTTAISGGEIWIPGSRHAREAGLDASVETAATYWEAEAGDAATRAMRAAYLASGAQAIDYLEAHTEVRFRAVAPHPDYHQDLPGASAGGRPLATLPFDGRRLGADFGILRSPRKDFMVLGGMMVSRDDIAQLLRPFASWRNFSGAARLVARHARDRLRHSRGTRLVLGNALVARMLVSLRARRVRIECTAALVELVREDDRIVGAIVMMSGRAVHVRARRGVVLATGGFARNETLRERYMSGLPVRDALCVDADVGDALVAATAVGADVDRRMQTPAYWMPASVMSWQNGERVVFPHIRDRAKPGLIAVNRAGCRFTNESASYHDFSLALFEEERKGHALPAYLVCDRRFIREHGIGIIKPRWNRLAPFIAAGYLVRGRDADDLARQIGVDPRGLAVTLLDYNAAARAGADPVFGKGGTVYNRHYGDPAQQPNPCLRPLEGPPYFAVAVRPAPIGTAVGLRIDADANVQDTGGMPLRGLYACGNDMASLTRGAYPGPGSTIGPAIVFAYRAVQHMARDAGATPVSDTHPVAAADPLRVHGA